MSTHFSGEGNIGSPPEYREFPNGNDEPSRLASAYQGVTDAWSLGITSLPAVVVDQRYVVYGEPDVARALARIEQHRRPQP